MDFGLILVNLSASVVIAVVIAAAASIAVLGFVIRISKKVARFFISGDALPAVRTASAAVPFLRYVDKR